MSAQEPASTGPPPSAEFGASGSADRPTPSLERRGSGGFSCGSRRGFSGRGEPLVHRQRARPTGRTPQTSPQYAGARQGSDLLRAPGRPYLMWCFSAAALVLGPRRCMRRGLIRVYTIGPSPLDQILCMPQGERAGSADGARLGARGWATLQGGGGRRRRAHEGAISCTRVCVRDPLGSHRRSETAPRSHAAPLAGGSCRVAAPLARLARALLARRASTARALLVRLASAVGAPLGTDRNEADP